MTYEYAKNNYQQLYHEAMKRGEKFSLFHFKERKCSIEFLEHQKFLKSASSFYFAKKRWVSKLRKYLQIKWNSIWTRCNVHGCNKFKYYGGRGIECRLNIDALEFLWHRDDAASMKKPSIDRINPDGHYEISNCQFIELEDNRRKRRSNSPLNKSLQIFT